MIEHLRAQRNREPHSRPAARHFSGLDYIKKLTREARKQPDASPGIVMERMRTAPGNIHPADVKAHIAKRGATLAAIARMHALHRSTVSADCTRPQPSGNRAIATFLDTSVQALWLAWFDETGARISTRRTHATDFCRPRHRENRKAA